VFGSCSARLQAGMSANLECPPEGGRYKFTQNRGRHAHSAGVRNGDVLRISTNGDTARSLGEKDAKVAQVVSSWSGNDRIFQFAEERIGIAALKIIAGVEVQRVGAR
jgi:hypothetical protein